MYPLTQLLQDIDFNKGLSMKSLLIPNNFDSDHLPSLVIHTFAHLTKTALPQHPNNFVPIRQMISLNNNIVPNLIIKAKICNSNRRCIFRHLACRQRRGVASTSLRDRRVGTVPYIWIIHHLALFERRHPTTPDLDCRHGRDGVLVSSMAQFVDSSTSTFEFLEISFDFVAIL